MHYPEAAKYIAKMTGVMVPSFGIYGKEEKLLFLLAAPYYMSNTAIQSNEMSSDWNKGSLQLPNNWKARMKLLLNQNELRHNFLIPCGKDNIWRKEPHHLLTYFSGSYLRAVKARMMIAARKNDELNLHANIDSQMENIQHIMEELRNERYIT